MTGLLDVPEEILICIIKQLDTKSLYNLYNTCQTLKTIILMHGVIRVCNLSVNSLSTAKSLHLNMIRQIAGHLYELNMSGVPDLRKSLLLPAIKRMKCLKTLDVTYTNITVLDIFDIHKNCQTINSISINFPLKNLDMPSEVLEEYQNVFKSFVNVHFVLTSWVSNLPLQVVKKSSLNTLKLTVGDRRGKLFPNEDMKPEISFEHFCIFMLHWANHPIAQGRFEDWLDLVKLDDIEFIILEYNESTCLVWTSPIFVQFFSENFKITAEVNQNFNKMMCGNVAILIWNRERTEFNELFFINLKIRIKKIFTCAVFISNENPLTFAADITDTQCYDRFHLNLMESIGTNTRIDNEQSFKKRRIVPTIAVLNYDKIFSNQKYLEVSVYFSFNGIVTLSTSNSCLRKITYLSLAGSSVRYSKEFFNVLFRCFDNLITLNVETSSLSPCCPPIMRSISLSRTLKNIRLLDKRIDFKMLFSSFSQCKTLENICIIDKSSEFNNLADPATLCQMCKNLYNVYIYATIKSSIEKNIHSVINSLLKKQNSVHYINFNVINTICDTSATVKHSSYDPYLDVFNINPIKPV